jgi:hypothetical protein
MTARFSRIGVDTRTLTKLGHSRDPHRGRFRRRLADLQQCRLPPAPGLAELGTEGFRVLIGKANSLWNEELLGMAYHGQGIGRYFPGNTSGQDVLTNLGLTGISFSVNTVPTYGAIAAYRRFLTTKLRSNFSYAYSHPTHPMRSASPFVQRRRWR